MARRLWGIVGLVLVAAVPLLACRLADDSDDREEERERAEEEREEREREAEERREAEAKAKARQESEAAEAEQTKAAEEVKPTSRPKRVKCRDGTLSPSCVCGESLRGCCSHHGGVAGCAD